MRSHVKWMSTGYTNTVNQLFSETMYSGIKARLLTENSPLIVIPKLLLTCAETLIHHRRVDTKLFEIVNLWFQDVRSFRSRLEDHPFILSPDSKWPLCYGSWSIYSEMKSILPQWILTCSYAVHYLYSC